MAIVFGDGIKITSFTTESAIVERLALTGVISVYFGHYVKSRTSNSDTSIHVILKEGRLRKSDKSFARILKIDRQRNSMKGRPSKPENGRPNSQYNIQIF